MVGFDPTRLDESNIDRFVAGAASGFITRSIVQPLDVLKIRFQLQVEPIRKSSPNSKYKSFTQATGVIIREEGLSSLWKGHVPAQFLSMGYGAVQFSGFHLLTELYARHIGLTKQTQPFVYFLCGGIAGVSATIVSHPFDVVRTRLIGQGEPKLYINMTQAFNHILKTEGFRGLYRGLTPNLILIGPQAGAIFLTYNICKKLWIDNARDATSNIWSQSFCCGAFSGMLGKSFVYPLDSIKKRLQVQGKFIFVLSFFLKHILPQDSKWHVVNLEQLRYIKVSLIV